MRRAPPLHRLALVATALCFFVQGTVDVPYAASMRGRISTASYRDIPLGSSFIVDVPSNGLSLSENNVRTAIERQLTANGLVVASDPQKAMYEVKFTIELGDPRVVSSPDVVFDGHSVGTLYARRLQVSVLDIAAGRESGNTVPAWQGEVFSEGRSADIGLLGPQLAEQVFIHFGKSVSNVRFKAKMRKATRVGRP